MTLKAIPAVLLGCLVLFGCSSQSDSRQAGSDDTDPTAQAGTSTAWLDAKNKCAGEQPCFTEPQQAIDAVSGQPEATVNVLAGTYTIPETAKPATEPGLTIDAPVTLQGWDSDDCQEKNSCPTIEFLGQTTTGLRVKANDVTIENLAFVQQEVPPSTPGGQLIEVPQPDPGTVFDDVFINEVVIDGGRRGLRASGQDLTVTNSVFTGQAADAILIPTITGSSAFQGNYFEGTGTSKKAINFEEQYQSLPASGDVFVEYNTTKGKNNLMSWNIWPQQAGGKVNLSVVHNTVVSSGGPMVAFWASSNPDAFGLFSAIAIDSNLFTEGGGTPVLVDYTGAGKSGAVPANSLIDVSNNLTYQNKEKSGVTADKTGVAGFGFTPDVPADASMKMFNVKDTVTGAPKVGAAPDYALQGGSAALGAGESGTNIGAWQGAAPVVRAVVPRCLPAGRTVNIFGKNIQGATTVLFGGVASPQIELSGNKIKAVVPDSTTTGLVDVTVTTDKGSATLRNGFRYPSPDSGC
ncbi:MAG: IPT/TIG domain-containing protein [Actinobacteria bacterium]|nr:IPT/TIG domain-containing protein [Actinomycetota bacterium]